LLTARLRLRKIFANEIALSAVSCFRHQRTASGGMKRSGGRGMGIAKPLKRALGAAWA